jgi:hypothetical protein
MNSMIPRKVIEIGVAGLTAVMTFIAGMPRIDCICPNGNVKHFCWGNATDSACCCAGSCCGTVAPSTRPAEKFCCCESANGDNSGRENKGQRAGQNPCRKQLADSTTTSIASTNGSPRSCEMSATLCLFAPSFSHIAVAPFGTWHHLSSPPTPLPPTDLLTTCKHLLI